MTVQKMWQLVFMMIPDIEQYVGLLPQHRWNITGRHHEVIDLVPQAIASLQKTASKRERLAFVRLTNIQ